MPDSAKPKRSARPSRRLPSAAPRQAPLVAIVGRPNVGKSTLFNRLAGQRLAIVEDVPGVTRDRQYATSDAIGRPFVLVDTGGFDPDTDDPLRGGIARHVQAAVAECDIIIAVLDGRAEPVAADHHVVHWLRQSPKPVIWVANKIDSPKQIPAAMNLYALGIDSVLPLSAMHGVGTGDLEEALAALLPQPETVAAPGDAPAAPDGSAEAALLPTVAIVGRPNAGKSSLVNALL
ncbi:MAG: GTPase, partial [Polyangiales bacterium]